MLALDAASASRYFVAVATRLDSYLSRLGIRNAWLADRCGYAESTISAWRRGERNPSVGARHVLASVLGITHERITQLLRERK